VAADGDAAAGTGRPDPAAGGPVTPAAPGPASPAAPGSGSDGPGPAAPGSSSDVPGPAAPGPASPAAPGSSSDVTGPAAAAGSGPAAPDSTPPGAPGRRPGSPDPAGPAAAPAPGRPLLSLVHAAKSFGAVRAVVDASIDLYGGEAHALVGENGAGKSTVVKILAGVHQPDEGQLLIEGQPAVLSGPASAQAAGIAVIYQEPTLFPDLTVAENIFMGQQPLLAGRRIDRRLMRTQSAALFERLGVQLDPGRISRGLSIADQQIVEIAKALTREARVIVMDEPTAALSAAEVARLFDVVRALRADGAAVLFISHRLEEVFEICQRVTVMRDGSTVLARGLAGLNANDLVRAMVGRDMPQRSAGERGQPGDEVLRVDRLTREGVFTDISLRVRAGEIVALAGLVGSGRSEVARAIFGIDRYDAGTVTVHGKELRKASPAAAMAAGIGYVPEDRRQQGLVMDMSIQQNVALASLARLRQGGLIRSAAERAFATDWAQRLRLKYGRLTDPVSMLSGGNQQKVVLAKWLGRGPGLLIVDEPTRGIDIATKADVHELLVRLSGEGVAILMISSELPEVLSVGDRILVMREGRLTAEYSHADASEEKIMSAATGQLERAR
jgi:rhamnose transport system ATP-binding protein